VRESVVETWEETDFKGTASHAGSSIKSGSKKAAIKVGSTFNKIKESEKTQNANRALKAFGKKFTGLFKKDQNVPVLYRTEQ